MGPTSCPLSDGGSACRRRLCYQELRSRSWAPSLALHDAALPLSGLQAKAAQFSAAHARRVRAGREQLCALKRCSCSCNALEAVSKPLGSKRAHILARSLGLLVFFPA